MIDCYKVNVKNFDNNLSILIQINLNNTLNISRCQDIDRKKCCIWQKNIKLNNNIINYTGFFAIISEFLIFFYFLNN